MLAGTHIALAVALGTATGASTTTLSLLAFGSLLPDIDHPQSTIGRTCAMVSGPLYRRFGHRRHVHGFPVWGALTVLGFLWWPFWWIGLGALSHCFVDCLNTSGVPLLLPFSEKVCVLFARTWRFPCGSRTELGFMAVLAICAYGFAYVGSVGGVRAIAGAVTQSPKMAYQQYEAVGLAICHFEGRLRFRTGLVEKGRWLVVGKEETHGIAVWDEGRQRMIHVPDEADFLRARLVVGKETWQAATVRGVMRTRHAAFFFDGKKWRRALPGGVVFGSVIGREIAVAGVGE